MGVLGRGKEGMGRRWLADEGAVVMVAPVAAGGGGGGRLEVGRGRRSRRAEGCNVEWMEWME